MSIIETASAPLPSVAVEDRLVDLEPARGLHVDVDVGQRLAQWGEEPLHQQPVAQQVHPGDPQQVVDQRPGPEPRAAQRTPIPRMRSVTSATVRK